MRIQSLNIDLGEMALPGAAAIGRKSTRSSAVRASTFANNPTGRVYKSQSWDEKDQVALLWEKVVQMLGKNMKYLGQNLKAHKKQLYRVGSHKDDSKFPCQICTHLFAMKEFDSDRHSCWLRKAYYQHVGLYESEGDTDPEFSQ